MITRWRIEVESPDKEEVMNDMDEATDVIMRAIRHEIDGGVQWECTDEHGPEPVDRNGDAVFYMRRVFRVNDPDEGPRRGD